MGFKAWNINEMTVSLNAILLSTGGYAEDEVVTVEWDDDWFSAYVGADGEVTRVRTNNFSAIATLKYAQTAGANDVLSGILLADIKTVNGGGAGAFAVRDTGGKTIVGSSRAWIIGPPEIKLGKTVNVNEWRIKLADARTAFVGGR